MTETEWLGCAHDISGRANVLLWDYVQRLANCVIFDHKASGRKVRLFACACCRRIEHFLDDEHREMLARAEEFADGAVPKPVFDQMRQQGWRKYYQRCSQFVESDVGRRAAESAVLHAADINITRGLRNTKAKTPTTTRFGPRSMQPTLWPSTTRIGQRSTRRNRLNGAIKSNCCATFSATRFALSQLIPYGRVLTSLPLPSQSTPTALSIVSPSSPTPSKTPAATMPTY